LPQCRDQVDLARKHRRHCREPQRHEQGDAANEREYAPIHRQPLRQFGANNVVSRDVMRQSSRDRKADRAAEHGEQHALSEVLLQQSPLGCAESAAHCCVTALHDTTEDEQVRHVGTCDEQHEQTDREQRV
jgi:hypothetical protein